MKKAFKVSLTFMAVLLSIAFAWAEGVGGTKVTTTRSWDFTKGKNHADQVTDCEYWSASSSGRYSLAKALEDQEMPGNDGVLTGLEGLYLTVPSAVYGVSGNYCLQGNEITIRIPNCGANDEIIVDFATSNKNNEATLNSDDIIETETFSHTATSSGETSKETVHAKADGDVVLKVFCSKGARLYSVTVNPYVGELPEVPTPEEPAFKDVKVELTNGNLLTAEEKESKSLVKFGVAVADDGSVSRVEADDASAAIVVEGKYHSDEHGWGNFSSTVKVDGPVKVSMGTCAWGGDVTVTSASGESFKFNTNTGACYHNNKTENIASGIYKGEATTLTISGGSYTPYIAIEAVDPADLKEEFDVTFTAGDFENAGVLPEALKIEGGKTFTVPANFTMYQEGKTLTGWSDGDKTYAIGEEVTVSNAMTLTPVFVANTVTLADRTEPVTVTFEFQRQNGAPTVGYQNVTGFWVAQAKIGGETIDVKADFDTNNGGKFANANWNDWAQLNSGTKFTVPSCQGAIVSLESYSETNSTVDGEAMDINGNVASFTVGGKAETVDVVIGDKGSYYRYIKVMLPVAKSAGGTSYNGEEASVIWPFNDAETYATAVTVAPEGAFSMTSFDAGVCSFKKMLTVTVNPGVNYVEFNSQNGGSDIVSWNLKAAKGLTFTPTKVSFYISRDGTDGTAEGVSVTLKAGDKSVVLDKITPVRNNKNIEGDNLDKYAGQKHLVVKYERELTADEQAQLATGDILSLVLNNGYDPSKGCGYSDVQIHGTLRGTTQEVAMFTVTAEPNLAEAGTVKVYPVSDEYEQGASVKLTAEKNFGYAFVNWTDAEGKVVGTEKEFVYTVEANSAFTANFKAINTYELAYTVNGGNDYQVAASPAPVEVDGKNMYEEGTKVTLTATSNKVVKFNNWQDGSTSSEYTLTMDADHTDIVAEFAADDYIAIWDFIRPGNNGRVADFYSEGNDASTLVLINDKGETAGWLDKSQLGAGGYEGRPGGVNWTTVELGHYAWQLTFNAEAFTDIKIEAGMVYNYNAYKTYNVEFSIDEGENWTKVGSITVEGSKHWADGEFTLPKEADNQAKVLVRFIADKTSNIDGTTSNNDGNCIGAVYVTGSPKLVDDGTAPVLESTVPAEDADNASINGKIILNFDEKVKIKEGVKATLGDYELEPEVTGKVVTFTYKNLNYETAYTFTLPAGAVSDLTDNAYDKAITIKFETKSRPEVAKAHYDRVVKTVDELVAAINDANNRADKDTRFRIFIHNGTYKIPASETATKTGGTDSNPNKIPYPDPITYITASNISFIGESRDGVIITNTVPTTTNGGSGTNGGCIAEGIGNGDVIQIASTAKNTYFQHLTIKSAMGDNKGRDVELHDRGDKTILKDVCLWGYQDTYTNNNQNGRFYFEGGVVRGRTDFLCGKGDVYFNGVELRMVGSGGYLAVPSTPKEFGWIFRDCEITGENQGSTPTDGNFTLGRPWGSGTPIALYINTKMTVKPSDVGWNEMGSGYPARFAEYNSTTAAGTVIDLAKRKKTFGDGHANNPVLTKAEADALTLTAVLGGDDDWDPATHAEQAPAATNVKHNASVITWDDCKYASVWAVLKDGEIIGFTTEPTFTLPAADASRASEPVYSVRAANEMGGLGEAVVSTFDNMVGLDDVIVDSEIISTVWYNLQGQRVSDNAEGILIRVDTLANGSKVTTKVSR